MKSPRVAPVPSLLASVGDEKGALQRAPHSRATPKKVDYKYTAGC